MDIYIRLKRIVSEYEYISFDLYDTLLKRYVVRPTDVFSIVEASYKKRYEEEGITNFREIRTNAERNLRHISIGEVDFDDIYKQFDEQYPNYIIERYKKIEIEVEQNITCVNQEMFNIYNECIANGKKVFLISDMYLPKKIINKVLERNGIKEYSKLYLSSEVGKTKRSGQIFQEVLEKERINSSQLIHIGDNYRSDFIMPRKRRIRSFYFRNKNVKGNNNDPIYNLLDKYTKSLIENSQANEFKKIGVSILGPLLYGYIKWLENSFKNNKYDKVLFFSREGFLIEKTYSLICAQDGLSQCYFYASRQALQVAAICIDSDFEEIMNAMFLPYQFDVEWLIRKWGLNAKEFLNEIKSCELLIDEKLNKFKILKDERIRKLYELLKKNILVNSENEKACFIKYLEKNEIKGNVAIVDIGWNGNMQKAFEKIVKCVYPAISDVTGYYLGIFTDTNNYKIQKMHSFIYKENGYADYLKDLYIHTILELFFMAPHGTLVSYASGNGEAELLNFADFEYANTDTFKHISEIQQGAIDFVKSYNGIGTFFYEQDKYVEFALEKFKNPSVSFAKNIGSLEVWEQGWVSIANPKKISYYIFHPQMLFSDFMKSSWKIGFLKRLFLLPVNYVMILAGMRKSVKRYLDK